MLLSACLLTLSVSAPMPALPPNAPTAAQSAMAVEEAHAVCPVCGSAIEPGKGTKVMVRDREYTVETPACGEKLAAHPDEYLESDGTPKNGKKEAKPN